MSFDLTENKTKIIGSGSSLLILDDNESKNLSEENNESLSLSVSHV